MAAPPINNRYIRLKLINNNEITVSKKISYVNCSDNFDYDKAQEAVAALTGLTNLTTNEIVVVEERRLT